jgi:protein gp37
MKPDMHCGPVHGTMIVPRTVNACYNLRKSKRVTFLAHNRYNINITPSKRRRKRTCTVPVGIAFPTTYTKSV